MWELALGLTAALAGRADSTAACSRMIQWGVRPAAATALSLRATTDSVRDDRLPPPSPESGRKYVVDAQRGRVYGQKFTVTAVTGQHARYWEKQRVVVLVWWQLGADCSHRPPRSALHSRIQELFIAARPSLPPADVQTEPASYRMLAAELRPPEYWVEGIPTVDVQWDVAKYSPARPAPSARNSGYRFAEYDRRGVRRDVLVSPRGRGDAGAPDCLA